MEEKRLFSLINSSLLILIKNIDSLDELRESNYILHAIDLFIMHNELIH